MLHANSSNAVHLRLWREEKKKENESVATTVGLTRKECCCYCIENQESRFEVRFHVIGLAPLDLCWDEIIKTKNISTETLTRMTLLQGCKSASCHSKWDFLSLHSLNYRYIRGIIVDLISLPEFPCSSCCGSCCVRENEKRKPVFFSLSFRCSSFLFGPDREMDRSLHPWKIPERNKARTVILDSSSGSTMGIPH